MKGSNCDRVLVLPLLQSGNLRNIPELICFDWQFQGKFVVTATQMLDSMERAPRPTRAEATDVTRLQGNIGTHCLQLVEDEVVEVVLES